MTRLTEVLDTLIESRGLSREEYAQKLIDGGWEEDVHVTLRVLNDEIIPCHDVIWGTEVVLGLSEVELEHLKAAAYADYRERASRGRAGMPGSPLD